MTKSEHEQFMVAKRAIERLMNASQATKPAMKKEPAEIALKVEIEALFKRMTGQRELNAQQLACIYVILGREVPDKLKRELGLRTSPRRPGHV